MRKKIGNIIIFTIFVVTFWFSSKEATESAGQSTGMLVKMRIITQEEVGTEKHYRASAIIRKGAHFSLYFIAGFGAFLSTGSIKRSILVVASMGTFDEIHQYFIPGRGAQVTDVLLDTLGGTTGAVVTMYGERILQRVQERRPIQLESR